MAAVTRRHLLGIKVVVLLILRRCLRKNRRSSSRFLVRPFFASCPKTGLFATLVKEHYLFDHEYFFHSFRKSPSTYESLVKMVAHCIKKRSTFRDTSFPEELLAVTLRYLATGDSQRTMIGTSYRISPTTILFINVIRP